MNIVLTSIIMTNMSVANISFGKNYLNTTYIDESNKFISLVHMADILNIAVSDEELLK